MIIETEIIFETFIDVFIMFAERYLQLIWFGINYSTKWYHKLITVYILWNQSEILILKYNSSIQEYIENRIKLGGLKRSKSIFMRSFYRYNLV